MSRQITRLFYELLEKHDNVLLSPLSLEIALGMAANGAAATTLDELEDFLGFEIDTINELYKDFLEQLTVETENSKTRIANSLWVDQHLTLLETFRKHLNKYYHADSKSVTFPSNEANQQMADWVKDKTSGLIQPEMESDGPLVLLNTLYFKDTWMHPFDKKMTSEDVFHTSDNKEVKTTFMHKKIDFHQYSKADDYISTSLYYGSEYRMQFILPNSDISLEMLLTKHDIDYLFQMETSPISLNIALPKFKFQNKLGLKEPLMSTGITKAFSDTEANFSKMSEDPLYIEDIIQEAGISVDEYGTEAAAYTKIDISRMAMPITETIDFYLNRPFLYGILSKDNHLLFVGAYRKPE